MGRDRGNVNGCQRFDLFSYPSVRQRGNGRDLEPHPASAIINSLAQVVSTVETFRLLEDWIARALQIAGRFYHLDECAFNPLCQDFLVDLLSAERAASRFDRFRLEQPLRLTHQ